MGKRKRQAQPTQGAAPGFDVVLGFDMETDIGSFTPFYEGVKHGTPRLLKLLKKHGIRATFFWTAIEIASPDNDEDGNYVRQQGHQDVEGHHAANGIPDDFSQHILLVPIH